MYTFGIEHARIVAIGDGASRDIKLAEGYLVSESDMEAMIRHYRGKYTSRDIIRALAEKNNLSEDKFRVVITNGYLLAEAAVKGKKKVAKKIAVKAAKSEIDAVEKKLKKVKRIAKNVDNADANKARKAKRSVIKMDITANRMKRGVYTKK